MCDIPSLLHHSLIPPSLPPSLPSLPPSLLLSPSLPHPSLPPSGIVRYMKRQAGPSSTPLNSEAEVNEFAPGETETRAVAFLSDPRALDSYFEAGNEIRLHMRLGHCTDAEVAREMGAKMGQVIVFHAL